jgi:hypothetical protein
LKEKVIMLSLSILLLKALMSVERPKRFTQQSLGTPVAPSQPGVVAQVQMSSTDNVCLGDVVRPNHILLRDVRGGWCFDRRCFERFGGE